MKLADDRGTLGLPDAMVGVIVSGICLAMMATAVGAFGVTAHALRVSAEKTTNETITADQWQSDANRALAVDQHGGQTVFTMPNTDGTCRQATWALDNSTLVRRTVNAPTIDYSQGRAQCSGDASDPSAVGMLTEVDTVAASVMSASGRNITYEDGEPSLDPNQSKPAGVSQADWDDARVGIVSLSADSNGHEYETAALTPATGENHIVEAAS